MILTKVIKSALGRRNATTSINTPSPAAQALSVLNVGGGSKRIPIPPHYDGWDHYLLDIAEGDDVDVVLDARKLATLDAAQFDAIYCSHNLEHYHPHHSTEVLAGFLHVLKPSGYAEIRVPDMTSVLKAMINASMDIEDVLYMSPNGPITVHDVIYGWGVQIERSGVDFYAHKRGFTKRSLTKAIERAGFSKVFMTVSESIYEIQALAFKGEPTEAQRATFGF
jgi:SAM-dependent methyltransferase